MILKKKQTNYDLKMSEDFKQALDGSDSILDSKIFAKAYKRSCIKQTKYRARSKNKIWQGLYAIRRCLNRWL